MIHGLDSIIFYLVGMLMLINIKLNKIQKMCIKHTYNVSNYSVRNKIITKIVPVLRTYN